MLLQMYPGHQGLHRLPYILIAIVPLRMGLTYDIGAHEYDAPSEEPTPTPTPAPATVSGVTMSGGSVR